MPKSCECRHKNATAPLIRSDAVARARQQQAGSGPRGPKGIKLKVKIIFSFLQISPPVAPGPPPGPLARTSCPDFAGRMEVLPVLRVTRANSSTASVVRRPRSLSSPFQAGRRSRELGVPLWACAGGRAGRTALGYPQKRATVPLLLTLSHLDSVYTMFMRCS